MKSIITIISALSLSLFVADAMARTNNGKSVKSSIGNKLVQMNSNSAKSTNRFLPAEVRETVNNLTELRGKTTDAATKNAIDTLITFSKTAHRGGMGAILHAKPLALLQALSSHAKDAMQTWSSAQRTNYLRSVYAALAKGGTASAIVDRFASVVAKNQGVTLEEAKKNLRRDCKKAA